MVVTVGLKDADRFRTTKEAIMTGLGNGTGGGVTRKRRITFVSQTCGFGSIYSFIHMSQ